MAETFLMDAWAVLAYLKQESPADKRVVDLLQKAQTRTIRLLLSVVNLGEVYYSIGRTRGEAFADQVLAELRLTALEILPIDEATVLSAARWKIKYPISYADAFAAAVAEENNAVLLTGDPELLALRKYLRIEPLARKK